MQEIIQNSKLNLSDHFHPNDFKNLIRVFPKLSSIIPINISANKKVFDLFEDKVEKDYEDKVIKTISYKGKTESSALCIYRISTIEFKNVPNYLVYTVEIVTDKNYKKYLNKLDEILISAKKN